MRCSLLEFWLLIYQPTSTSHAHMQTFTLMPLALWVVFANGLGDWSSIPGRVISETQKMVLDAALLKTQHYKVRIKGKVEQSKERSSAFPDTSV